MHEPLTIAVVFPYLSRQPWELRKTGLMVEMGGKVQRMLKENPTARFNLLSNLCILMGKMESMSVQRLCSAENRGSQLIVLSTTSLSTSEEDRRINQNT